MESKTVTIYKTTAIGKTQFMFTSGQADPLNLESGARRFFVVEGAKTAEAIAIANSSDVVVVPPNAEVTGLPGKGD